MEIERTLDRKLFKTNFKIINKDQYKANSFHLDCYFCEKIVINPKICKECCTLFCKQCADNFITSTSLCLSNCKNYTIVNPVIFIKNSIDQIKLKCTLG